MQILKSQTYSEEKNTDFNIYLSTECQKLDTTPNETTPACLLFDLAHKECKSLSFEEVLNKSIVYQKQPCLLYIIVDSKETIQSLFKAYKFNPLIESECSEWSFKEKDYVMTFDTTLFISLSDCSLFEDIENPIQVKIIIYNEIILVLTFEKTYFIEQIFKKELNFKNFNNGGLDENLCLITGNHNIENSMIRSEKKIPLSGGSLVETILYRILDTIIGRYEKILFAMLVECRTCMIFSTEISYKERIEYLVRVSVTEKSLIYLSQLVKPKIEIIKSLLVQAKKRPYLKLFVECLYGRIKKMNQLNKTGKNLLHEAKQVYSTCCEDKIIESSMSQGKLMRFYSGVTTLSLPPFLMAGLWGTNINLPGSEQTNTNTFSLFLGMTLIYFLFGLLYLRKIGWI